MRLYLVAETALWPTIFSLTYLLLLKDLIFNFYSLLLQLVLLRVRLGACKISLCMSGHLLGK